MSVDKGNNQNWQYHTLFTILNLSSKTSRISALQLVQAALWRGPQADLLACGCSCQLPEPLADLQQAWTLQQLHAGLLQQ